MFLAEPKGVSEMSNTSRKLWSWATGLALVGAASIGGSRAGEDRPIRGGQQFIKVGRYYINAARIDYAITETDGLAVIFGSDAGNHLRLTGDEAGALRSWLDERAGDGQRPQEQVHRQQQGYPQRKDASGRPDSRNNGANLP